MKTDKDILSALQKAEFELIKETIESFKDATQNFFLKKFLDIYKNVIDTFPDEFRLELKKIVEEKLKK